MDVLAVADALAAFGRKVDQLLDGEGLSPDDAVERLLADLTDAERDALVVLHVREIVADAAGIAE